MAMGPFDVRNLIRPVAPGVPGAVNPLSMIGAGMASNNMLGALQGMGQLGMNAQQLALQQEEADRQRAAHAQAMARNAAIQRAITAPVEVPAEGPPTPAGEYPTRLEAPEIPRELEIAALIGPDAVGRYMQAKHQSNLAMQLAERESQLRMDLEEQKARLAQAQPPDLTEVSGMRKEYTKQSEAWQNIRDAYARMESAQKTGAGDIALIFSYMKILDPTSVVREGEFATAANAGGVIAGVRNLYNRVLTGERLNEEIRQNFLSQGKALTTAQLEQQLNREEIYGGIAQRNQLPIEDAVPDLIGDYRKWIIESGGAGASPDVSGFEILED